MNRNYYIFGKLAFIMLFVLCGLGLSAQQPGTNARLSQKRTAVGGNGHGLMVMPDGRIQAIGENSNGQLGDGTTTDRLTVITIAAPTNFIKVAAGYEHSIGLTADGKVYTWGDDSAEQLGDGAGATDVTTPTMVAGITNAIDIAAGAYTSYVLLADGTVMAWGLNNFDQVGDGTFVDQPSPVAVPGASNVVHIASNPLAGHAMALRTDGRILTWGLGVFGALGDGVSFVSSTPVLVDNTTGLNYAVNIWAGAGHSVAIRHDGTVYAWGQNTNGQLGDASTTDKTTPVPMTGVSNALAGSAGNNHTVVLLGDGTAVATGMGTAGQLGNGGTASATTIGAVSALTNATEIASGNEMNFAIRADGSLYYWGYDVLTTTQTTTPTASTEYYRNGCGLYEGTATGTNFSLGLRSNGTVAAVGNNTYGQLGNGTLTNTTTPISIATITNIKKVVAGNYASYALTAGGQVYAWGRNDQGQLGDGTIVDINSPQLVPGLSNVIDIANTQDFTLFLLANGEVWGIGDNSNGQLGNNINGTDELSAVKMQGATTPGAIAISAGNNHTAIIRADGNVAVCGAGGAARLGGLGAKVVATLNGTTNCRAITCPGRGIIYILGNGQVWSNNINTYGEAGTGTAAGTQVTTETNTGFTNAKGAAGGVYHVIILEADGTVTSFGRNNVGQLGDGTTTDRISPVASSGVDMKYVYSSQNNNMFVKADGTLWGFGQNTNGSLGNGSTTNITTSTYADEYLCTLNYPSGTVTNNYCRGGSLGKVTFAAMSASGACKNQYQFSKDGTALASGTYTDENLTDGHDFTGLAAGTYYIWMRDKDATTCERYLGSYTVTEPAAFSNAGSTDTDNFCVGGTAGAINQTITGGVDAGGSYAYAWSDAGPATEDRAGLAGSVAGTVYTVTVTGTGTGGCTTTVSYMYTITEPAAWSNAASIDVDNYCVGGTAGTIVQSITGGSDLASYAYDWGGGVTTQNRNSLAAGTYTCTVTATGSGGCTTTNAFIYTITEPAAWSNAGSTTVNNYCVGGALGTITQTITGGTDLASYTYNWGGGIITPGRTLLAAGTYTCTITGTGTGGCTTTTSYSYTITEPAAWSNAGSTDTDNYCNGGLLGAIDQTITGGTDPETYTFAWSDAGPATIDRSGLAGSVAGIVYTCTITGTGTGGCTTSTSYSYTITEPAAWSNAGSTDVDNYCYGGTLGTITQVITGGVDNVASYTYAWSDGPVTTLSRVGLAGSVAGIVYTCTITGTGTGGCTSTTSYSYTITQPANFDFTGSSDVDNYCYGGSIGTIDQVITGGSDIESYTYAWSDGAIVTQDRNSLPAGTYTCTVTATGTGGCTVTTSATYTITEPAAWSNAGSTDVDNYCVGGTLGSITQVITGGTAPETYTYAWSDAGPATLSRTNLAGSFAGTVYTCTITGTGTGGCTTTTSYSYTITQPAAWANVSSTVDNYCYGGALGEIYQAVTGGTDPETYTFAWSDAGAAIEDRTNLAAGTYTCTITGTGTGGCTTSTSYTYTITEPAAWNVSVTAVPNYCYGGTLGSIDQTVSGGVDPAGTYAYAWSDGPTNTEDRTNLSAATYTVTITGTGTGGCTTSTTATYTITQPAAWDFTGSVDVDNYCYGGSLGTITQTITGGVDLAPATYTYAWSDGAIVTRDRTNLTGTTAGTVYTVTVTGTGSGGCTTSTTATYTITQPAAWSNVGSSTTDNYCRGGSAGAISQTITGGTDPETYTYDWGGGVTSQNRTLLAAGTYTCTITGTGTGGCTTSTSYIYTITEPAAWSNAASVVVPNYCLGGTIGTITQAITGGTDPETYTYDWGGGVTSQNRTNLAAGTYTCTITGTGLSGCTTSTSFTYTITEPAAWSNAGSVTVPNYCYGGTLGSITQAITGGTDPETYTYNWGGGVTSQNRTNLAAGTYICTVTGTGLSGCTTSTSFTYTITEPAAWSNLPSSTVDNVCFGGTIGEIWQTLSGGTDTESYTYSWSDGGATTEDRTGLAAGTYIVTVSSTGTGGCTTSTSYTYTITEPAQLNATINARMSASCANTGKIWLTSPTGGFGTYEYSIVPSASAYSWQASASSVETLAPGTYKVSIRDAAVPTCIRDLAAAYVIDNSGSVPALPSAPTITITNITYQSAVLTWAPLYIAPITHTYIRYRVVGNATWKVVPIPIATTSFILSPLNNYSTYELEMAPGISGCVDWVNSSYTTFTTLQQPTTIANGGCYSPGNFRVLSTGSNSVTLAWSALASHKAYLIKYQVSGSAYGPEYCFDAPSTGTTITGLLTNKPYKITIRANCTVGCGGVSVTTSTSTVVTSGNRSSNTPPIDAMTTTRSLESTGIGEDKFTIYPNPTTGVVNLRYSSISDATATVRVLDLTGKVVLEQTAPITTGDNNISLDLTGNAAGVYLVQFKQGDNIQNAKVQLK